MKTLVYVHDEFGLKAAEKLRENIDKWVNILKYNPEVASPEQLLSSEPILYRSIIVGNHNKIVFHYDDKYVYISDFWDMRREPSKLSGRVKKK